MSAACTVVIGRRNTSHRNYRAFHVMSQSTENIGGSHSICPVVLLGEGGSQFIFSVL